MSALLRLKGIRVLTLELDVFAYVDCTLSSVSRCADPGQGYARAIVKQSLAARQQESRPLSVRLVHRTSEEPQHEHDGAGPRNAGQPHW